MMEMMQSRMTGMESRIMAAMMPQVNNPPALIHPEPPVIVEERRANLVVDIPAVVIFEDVLELWFEGTVKGKATIRPLKDWTKQDRKSKDIKGKYSKRKTVAEAYNDCPGEGNGKLAQFLVFYIQES